MDSLGGVPFTKRLIVALVLATATAAFAAPTGTAQQAAGSAQCANRETPPPPVDTSEQPAACCAVPVGAANAAVAVARTRATMSRLVKGTPPRLSTPV